MSAIRPQPFQPSPLFPAQPSSPAGASRSEFFRSALRALDGPAAPAPQPATETPVRDDGQSLRRPDPAARPGSLLDIRV